MGHWDKWDKWDNFVKSFPLFPLFPLPSPCGPHLSVCVLCEKGHERVRLTFGERWAGCECDGSLPRGGGQPVSIFSLLEILVKKQDALLGAEAA